jgi:hypothetical protein
MMKNKNKPGIPSLNVETLVYMRALIESMQPFTTPDMKRRLVKWAEKKIENVI